MFQPLVSIIIPSFNREKLINDTLKSVMAQEYTNWECIIVDDGSSDNTVDIVMGFVEKDSRFSLYRRPKNSPKGANSCRNYGFEKSKGDYINWLDSDDLFSSDKISSQISSIDQNSSERTIITSKWNFFSDNTSVGYKELDIYKNYDSGYDLIEDFGNTKSLFPPHSYLVSREVIVRSGLWNEYLQINQDGEFFVRALLCAQKVIHAENGMVLFRNHEGDRVSNYSSEIKVNHAILSWKLISIYLNLVHQKETREFIEYAKEYVYLRTRKWNKDSINRNRKFFKKQIYKFSFKNKIRKKLMLYKRV